MKCLILAAGYATRLYPLTENFPKPLLSVSGKAIIDWLIDDVATACISEFIIVSNHKFANHFSKWSEMNSHSITVVDDGTSSNETRLGAVKDIQYAVETLGINDDLLVLAGDNLLDFSLSGFISYSKNKDTSCVMCHEETDIEKMQRTAIIDFNEDGVITSYEEKPKLPKGHYAVPPFYYYKVSDLKRISEALEEGISPDAPGSFAAWLSTKVSMHAYIMPGKRFDIGNIESYQKVQNEYHGIN